MRERKEGKRGERERKRKIERNERNTSKNDNCVLLMDFENAVVAIASRYKWVTKDDRSKIFDSFFLSNRFYPESFEIAVF